MGVSCAVYNLSPHGATDFPLLEATKQMKLEARESLQSLNSEERFLECLRVFEGGVTSEDSFPGLAECFQDLDSMQQREHQVDEKPIKFEEEDLSFSLVTEELPWSCSGSSTQQDPFSLEAAAVGKYQQNCELGKIGFQTSFADNNEEKPEGLFDLWEGQERKELMGVCKETSLRQGDTLLEWAGDSITTTTNNDWNTTGSASDSILTFEDRERLWFTFPQLKCQQALPELTRIGSTESLYGPAASGPISQHCPATSTNFDLMYSQGQLDALSRPVGLLQAEPCKDTREQQNMVSHMDSSIGSWQEPAQAIFSATTQSKNDQKAGLPSRAGRKCRMARKRRALPYHVPLPACSTSKKSVEELITEKNLEFLLQKELKPSDVGNLGRIVLPKREAEGSLPYLTAREGMTIVMEDLTTAYKWHMRYRFWPNNKSRMYLLENTGEFVRSHCLKEGDLLRLYKYRDSESGKYVILGKKASSCKEDSASPRSRSLAFGEKKNKPVKSKRDDSVSSIRNKSCKIDANSRFRDDKFMHLQETSSSSGSERDGLANFEAFEASDIQEILTSLG